MVQIEISHVDFGSKVVRLVRSRKYEAFVYWRTLRHLGTVDIAVAIVADTVVERDADDVFGC